MSYTPVGGVVRDVPHPGLRGPSVSLFSLRLLQTSRRVVLKQLLKLLTLSDAGSDSFLELTVVVVSKLFL